MSDRGRWALLVTLIAVFVAGASTVYLVGSSNRRADRQAVLDFEARVLAQVQEMNVLSGSMLDAAEAYRAGKIQAQPFVKQVREWKLRFEDVTGKLATVRVPPAIGVADPMFVPAARSWAEAAERYAAYAECGPPADASCVALGRAADAAAGRALTQYRAARASLQAARKRLDLGTSANFPESPPR